MDGSNQLCFIFCISSTFENVFFIQDRWETYKFYNQNEWETYK